MKYPVTVRDNEGDPRRLIATELDEFVRWIDTLDQLTADDSDAERRKLFHDNAIAFYRLA